MLSVLLLVVREPKLGFATNSEGGVVGGGGKDTLASVRTRAEGRGTTVYASAKYPAWETSKVFLLENVEGIFL